MTTFSDWAFVDIKPVSPASRAPYFTIAASAGRVKHGEDPLPASQPHAKTMGSQSTACGLPASGWPRFFHVPFPVGEADACPECRSVVLSTAPRRRRTR